MTPRRPSRPDQGAALLLALLVLAIASAAVLLAFTAALFEWQAGSAAGRIQQAIGTAESGLASVRSGWSPLFDTLPRGQAVALPVLSLGTADTARMALLPLSGAVYRIASEGRHTTPRGTATAFLAEYVRLDAPLPEIAAALTAVDTVVVSGGTSLDGSDSVPPGWGGRCPSLAAGLPALRLGTGTNWSGTCSGCAGSPPVLLDSTLTTSVLDQFGPDDYASLAARAVHVVGGMVTGVGPVVAGAPAVCLVADSLNWGEPLAAGPAVACRGFFPIIHATGDLQLNGGRGQGVLLVDGNLDLSGGASFTGVLVVLGRLTASGSGGSILGGVLADRVSSGSGVPFSVQYSSCAVQRVLQAAGRPVPIGLEGWHWTQLY